MDTLRDLKLYFEPDYAIEALRKGIDLETDGFVNNKFTTDKIAFHCYWYGKLGRKQIFSIKSFLCTQNLERCRLILWLDAYNGYEFHTQNPLLQPILNQIEVKAYDPIAEIEDTPWENHSAIVDRPYNSPKRSDAFRYLILYKYGGVYFDLDIMFLEDFGQILSKEFCYAWETEPYANSAVFYFKPESVISEYLLFKVIAVKTVIPMGILNYSDYNLKNLFVFPCAFFDPLWQGLSLSNIPFNEDIKFFTPFSDEFKNHLNIDSFKDFFPGCYTFHWHNQWNTQEFENSFFAMFDLEFNKILKIS